MKSKSRVWKESLSSGQAEPAEFSPRVHIFDVDGTLYRGSTVRDFLFLGFRSRQLPLGLAAAAGRETLRSLVTGRPPGEASGAFPFLSGFSRDTLLNLSRKLFSRKLPGRLDSVLAGRIAGALEKNQTVLLATSSFRVLVEPLAEYLSVADIIATELEYREGLSTGALKNGAVFGQGKRIQVEHWLGERGIPLSVCAFYSDSHRDLPLLETVGYPVAVRPDRRLKKTAAARGWPVLTGSQARKTRRNP